MRKSFLAVAAAGLAMTLAACGSGTTPTSTSSTQTSESASEAATTAEATETTAESSAPAASGSITIWADEVRVNSFTEVAKSFTDETGIAVEMVQKPTQDIKTEFVTQAPTGEGPDLIVGAHDWTGDLVNNGVIAPVELGDAVGNFPEPAVQGFTYDGQLYGVPYASENIGLVRNNALATETPETFDELVAQGKELGAEFPVVIQQGEGGDAFHLYPLQTSFGAPVFVSENGEYTTELGMAGPEGLAFADYLKNLADEGVLSTAVGGDQAKQSFLDGKTPYIVTGPWYVADFVAADMDVTVLPVPSAGGQPSAPFLGFQGVYLSAHSENALLANQFLTFLAGAEAQTQLYELDGRFPANTESAAAVDDEILAGFGEAGKLGQPMPAIPEMGAVWTYWGAAQVSIITGAADPATAWNEMIANIQGEI
ncbi:maltose ABC transporter substrate-binding protein [Tessaracoccus sp. OS52]|uniref:sugar ABC transporter substrate-binding protein n=1 Tax=Tessaracoccus sp. OS52 TaxID=2886691 RepID=UPI001D104884|nr:maltose ABC transporter substrate-binding protein [Tessaracoccus sp. OS52]MCC2592101.1 maltose ABC transporter substrate-binding protein [Tessaracoccus sp. OS52]